MLTRAALLAAVAAVAAAPSPSPPIVRLDPPARAGSLAPNLSADGSTAILSWLEPPRPDLRPQDGSYALKVSRLTNGTWSPPATVASGTDFFANWADVPSITAGARGRLLAHWAGKSGGDKYAYDVRLARSDDGGKTWRSMGKVNDDRTASEHGFVSATPEGDRIRLFWLDGRDMASGGAHASGKPGSMTLRTAVVGDEVGASEVLDRRVCECCQTDAAATEAGPAVVYRDRSAGEVRDVAIVRRDGGRWTPARLVHRDGWTIDGCPVNGPAVAAAGRRVAVAWYTGGGNGARVQVAFSDDAGASFGPSAVVDRAGPLGRVDVVLAGNRDALVAWMATDGKSAAIRLARVTAGGRVGPAVEIARADPGRSSGFPRLARSGDTLVVAWVEAGEPSRIRASTLPASRVR